jgi:hypothetical protein
LPEDAREVFPQNQKKRGGYAEKYFPRMQGKSFPRTRKKGEGMQGNISDAAPSGGRKALDGEVRKTNYIIVIT